MLKLAVKNKPSLLSKLRSKPLLLSAESLENDAFKQVDWITQTLNQEQTSSNPTSQIRLSTIPTEVMDVPWAHFDVIPSTMDAYKTYPLRSSVTVYTADRMTSGRGRYGKNWQADKSNFYYNLTLTQPHFQIEDTAMLYDHILDCIIHTLHDLTGHCASKKTIDSDQDHLDPSRPMNDLILNDKKVCGVLIDSVIQQNAVTTLSIGIGINTHEKPQLETATCLLEATGISVEHTALTSLVTNYIVKDLKALKVISI